MKLDKYLQTSQTSSATFAFLMGVSKHAVSKWRQGIRIPRSYHLVKIHRITRGQVSINDWFIISPTRS